MANPGIILRYLGVQWTDGGFHCLNAEVAGGCLTSGECKTKYILFLIITRGDSAAVSRGGWAATSDWFSGCMDNDDLEINHAFQAMERIIACHRNGTWNTILTRKQTAIEDIQKELAHMAEDLVRPASPDPIIQNLFEDGNMRKEHLRAKLETTITTVRNIRKLYNYLEYSDG